MYRRGSIVKLGDDITIWTIAIMKILKLKIGKAGQKLKYNPS